MTIEETFKDYHARITVKERPILMSGPNIAPLLEGRKTQTRRALKESLIESIDYMGGYGEEEPATSESADIRFMEWHDDDGRVHGPDWCVASAEYPEEGVIPLGQCPYGKPGDRLWVREAWRTVPQFNQMSPAEIPVYPELPPIRYEADGAFSGFGFEHGRYRHARFMPRWASRILLEITSISVERLQDISEEDAISEGAEWAACGAPQIGSHKAGYARLWEFVNGGGSWDANPWVWAIKFARLGQQQVA